MEPVVGVVVPGGVMTRPSPLCSKAWLYRYRKATVPAAFSIPTVAELPWLTGMLISPVYANVMVPFSPRIASTEKSFCCAPKTYTLRHSTMYCLFGAVPTVSVRTEPLGLTTRSSQNA